MGKSTLIYFIRGYGVSTIQGDAGFRNQGACEDIDLSILPRKPAMKKTIIPSHHSNWLVKVIEPGFPSIYDGLVLISMKKNS